MRILLLAGAFQVRGSSVYTLRLARYLPDHGLQVQIVCRDARLLERGFRSRLDVGEYPQLNVPIWGRLVRAMLRRDLWERRPDLIHAQSRHELPLGNWLARRLQRPYVVTVHDYLARRERLPLDRRWGRRVIAVSEAVKAELVSRGRIADGSISVIHTGVEELDHIEMPPVLDPGHVPVVGMAGPLEAVKGLPYFLGAARRILDAGRRVEFLVAGAGPEEENIRRLARELGIAEHVTFVPNLQDLTEPLAAMDVYCLPSLQQGLGTIMLQAMALGKPVIATGVGGVYSVVRDGETGLVVPPRDSARLAERIIELLDDPVRARALGESARRLVREHFRVDQMIERTVRVYRQALQPEEAAAQHREPAAAS